MVPQYEKPLVRHSLCTERNTLWYAMRRVYQREVHAACVPALGFPSLMLAYRRFVLEP